MICENVTNDIYEYITKKKLPKVGFVTYDSDANVFDYTNFLE